MACLRSQIHPRRLSDFAAKRLQTVAQGFSPGSVSWKGALQVAPDVSARDAAKRRGHEPPLGRHFQGDFIGRLTQG